MTCVEKRGISDYIELHYHGIKVAIQRSKVHTENDMLTMVHKCYSNVTPETHTLKVVDGKLTIVEKKVSK